MSNYLTHKDLKRRFGVVRKTWRTTLDFPRSYKIAGTKQLPWKPEEIEVWEKENLEVA
jgi:hypothetical protein